MKYRATIYMRRDWDAIIQAASKRWLTAEYGEHFLCRWTSFQHQLHQACRERGVRAHTVVHSGNAIPRISFRVTDLSVRRRDLTDIPPRDKFEALDSYRRLARRQQQILDRL